MSVFKRNNRWYYYVKIRGRRYRGALPEARVKAQAMEAERRIRDEIFAGKYQTAQSRKAVKEKTFKEFFDETYLPWAKESKRSWKTDASRIKPILACMGKMKLSEITPFLIERYKITRSKSKVTVGSKDNPVERTRARASVNREIALISRLFSLAVSKREIASTPARGIKFLKGEVRRKRYLLPEEEERLMSHVADNKTLRLVLVIALNTGMRRGEILKLRVADLDFQRGEIHVTETKTDRDRSVPMNETIRRELFSRVSRSKSEYVFENPKTGKRIVSIQSSFETARLRAALEDFRFHDLRHTAATRMGEAGIDPFAIAAILGHSKINMTLSYTHATEAAKRRAVAALEGKTEKVGHNAGHNQTGEQRLSRVK